MTVLVGYLHGWTVDGWFHDCLVNLVWRDRGRQQLAGVIAVQSGPQIAVARNQLARQFLATDADWFLSLDSDMAFDADLADRLLASANAKRRPIVGAMAFGVGRAGTVYPTLRRLTAATVLEPVVDWPADQLVPVDATGMACVLVHRSVFERLDDGTEFAWFDEDTLGDTRVSEDITFCLRARRAGFPIYVHTGIDVGHVKPQAVTSAHWHAQQARI